MVLFAILALVVVLCFMHHGSSMTTMAEEQQLQQQQEEEEPKKLTREEELEEATKMRSLLREMKEYYDELQAERLEALKQVEIEYAATGATFKKNDLEAAWVGHIAHRASQIGGVIDKLHLVKKSSVDNEDLYGMVPSAPGLSCTDIASKNVGASSGTFWIDTVNKHQKDTKQWTPFRVYCDMDTLNGGWTQFAEKGLMFQRQGRKKHFVSDYNKDSLAFGRGVGIQMFQLSLNHFDQFAEKWEIMVALTKQGKKDAPIVVTIVPGRHSAMSAAQFADILSKDWSIKKDSMCADLDHVAKACRASEDASQNIDPWASDVHASWYIRRLVSK